LNNRELTLAIVGSGGDGVISAGEIIVKAAASEGLYSFLLKSFGPQIRGGESSCKIRLSDEELLSIGEETRILLCYSWSDYSRFIEEIKLRDDAVILSDEDDRIGDADLPIEILDSQTWIKVPLRRLANKEVGNILTKNIVSLGVLQSLFDLPEQGIQGQIRKRFAKKRKELVELNLQAIEVGRKWAQDFRAQDGPELPRFFDYEASEAKLVLSGNEATAVAALWAGLKFFAGYPITPASDIMEWLESRLPKVDGVMIQAEDEIASLGMAIGASFAGSKSMTATSGPGISLMIEMIGLAAMAEIPVVVVNVQRGGPSTGIPTKTGQSDLLQACHGLHGDAPHVVLAATDVKDCATISVEAFNIAEKYQIPVIVLLDQFVGQRVEAVLRYKLLREGIEKGWLRRVERELPSSADTAVGFHRYRFTENGVSPMSYPGVEDGFYIASGIEHNELGDPVSDVDIHIQMHDKRHRKLEHIRRDFNFMHPFGPEDAEIGILCWGSSKGPVREAMMQAEREYGIPSKSLTPSCLLPLDKAQIQEFVDGCERVIVTESSYGGQFFRYLRSEVDLPAPLAVPFAVTDGMPLPIKPLVAKIKEVHDELARRKS